MRRTCFSTSRSPERNCHYAYRIICDTEVERIGFSDNFIHVSTLPVQEFCKEGLEEIGVDQYSQIRSLAEKAIAEAQKVTVETYGNYTEPVRIWTVLDVSGVLIRSGVELSASSLEEFLEPADRDEAPDAADTESAILLDRIRAVMKAASVEMVSLL